RFHDLNQLTSRIALGGQNRCDPAKPRVEVQGDLRFIRNRASNAPRRPTQRLIGGEPFKQAIVGFEQGEQPPQSCMIPCIFTRRDGRQGSLYTLCPRQALVIYQFYLIRLDRTAKRLDGLSNRSSRAVDRTRRRPAPNPMLLLE